MSSPFLPFALRLIDAALVNVGDDPVSLLIAELRAAMNAAAPSFSTAIRLSGVAQVYVGAGYVLEASETFGASPSAASLNAMAQAIAYLVVGIETMVE